MRLSNSRLQLSGEGWYSWFSLLAPIRLRSSESSTSRFLLRSSRSLLRASRFSPIVYFAALLLWELVDLTPQDLPSLVLSSLSIAYLTLALCAYVRRGIADPVKECGWTARLVALTGANLLLPLSFLPDQHPFWIPFALAGSALGLGLSLWAMAYLRGSFSITPQAWRLVARGPYRYVRHPMYLGSFLIGGSLLLVKLSPEAVTLFAAFLIAQYLRLRWEERLLSDALPGYVDYKNRTRRLLPRFLIADRRLGGVG
ncbi:MAG: isoprenylcysteine carboxylmethyltransferase family protein [Chloroflexi bacterium]|nr:isoprenylcysteine carboxylmethyltransferase family protein [Chloroflexota bacterium]